MLPILQAVWGLRSVIIPYDNTIEKGTDLYNLYNTNIHKKIAMEKKWNKHCISNIINRTRQLLSSPIKK